MSQSQVVGERVRESRKRRGLTQRGLAQSSGVSVSLIRKLEQGEYGGVGTQTLRRLAAALGVTTTVLLAGARPAAGPAADSAMWEPLRRALAEPGRSGDRELVTRGGAG